MTQYDEIAEDYARESRVNHPQRKYVIYPSWINACGKLNDLRVLDLGCGSGHSSRLLAQKGAIVTGIDESGEQIRLARDKETRKSLGINYTKANAKNLPVEFIEGFDLVTPTFLFHYAKSEEELLVFVREAYRILKSDGQMVVINTNPKNPVYSDVNSSTVEKWIDEPFQDGSRIEVFIRDKHGKHLCSFITYHWSEEVYEECFRRAGFVNIKWTNLKITEEGKRLFQNWKDLENCHPLVLLTAQKP